MPIENNNEVSLKELREGFYKCRSFAVIWIMMAKGSKAWYDVYERYIFEIDARRPTD